MPTVKKTTKTGTKKTSLKDISARIKGLGDSLPTSGLKVNIYGRSGTGKTTFWATFPKRILAIVVSGGNQSGELLSLNTKEYRKSIDVLELSDSTEIPTIVEMLKEHPDQYQTVILDHATGLQELILAEILGLEQAPAQLSWGVASQKQWGQVGLQMKERLRSLLSLDQNVVIVAQEREFNGESETELKLDPYVASALAPSVVSWLNYSVDYILNTFIRQKKKTVSTKIGGKTITKKVATSGVDYCLRCAPHAIYATKFRAPKGSQLPEDIIDPTYEKLMEVIQGQVE